MMILTNNVAAEVRQMPLLLHEASIYLSIFICWYFVILATYVIKLFHHVVDPAFWFYHY